jgi:hypothetical protein
MIKRLFLQHPHDIGQTYFQHQRQALRIGTSMLFAGCACCLHAILPAAFTHTASDAVARLHNRMQLRPRSATNHSTRVSR